MVDALPEGEEYLVEVGEEDLEGSDSDPAEIYEILAEINGSEDEIEEELEIEVEHPFDLKKDTNRKFICQNQSTGDEISL